MYNSHDPKALDILAGDGRMRWLALRRMRSQDPRARQVAAQKLAGYQDRRTTEALVAALSDKDSGVSEMAARSLAAQNWQPPNPELRALFLVKSGRYADAISEGAVGLNQVLLHGIPYGRMNHIVLEALGKTGDLRAADLIIDLLGHLGWSIHADANWEYDYAVRALTQFGDPVVERLCRILGDGNWIVAKAAARILGAIRNPGAVEFLVEVIRDGNNVFVREKAIEALAAIGDKRAIAPLRDVLEGAKADIGNVVPSAAKALGELGDTASAEWLVGRLTLPRYGEPRPARELLQRMGQTAVPALIAALGAKEEALRAEATALLGSVGDASVIPVLMSNGQDPRAKEAIAKIQRKKLYVEYRYEHSDLDFIRQQIEQIMEGRFEEFEEGKDVYNRRGYWSKNHATSEEMLAINLAKDLHFDPMHVRLRARLIPTRIEAFDTKLNRAEIRPTLVEKELK